MNHLQTIMSMLILALSLASRGKYALKSVSYRSAGTSLQRAAALSENTVTSMPMQQTKDIKTSTEQQLKNALLSRQEGHVIDIVSSWNTSNSAIRSSSRSSVNRLLQLCSDANRHEYARLIISNLNQRFYAGVTDYEIIPFLQSCTLARKNAIAFDAVKLISDRGLQITAKALSILVQGFGRARNEKAIDDVLKYCVDNKISMDLIFLHNLMDAYIKCNNIYKCVDLFQLIFPETSIRSMLGLSPSMAIPASTYGIMMKSYQYAKPNTRSFNIFLKAIREYCRTDVNIHEEGRASTLTLSYKLLQKMKDLRISPDAVTINTVIDIAVVEGELEKAEELIVSNDIAEPTVEAFTSIISGYGDRGNVDAAYRILNLMSSRNINPNAYTVTSLMTACLKANDLSKAKSILENQEMMSSLNDNEKALVHGSYVAGLCSLATKSVDNSVVPYNDLTANTEKLQLLYQAMFHLLEMDYLGIQGDVTTINAVMKAVALCLPNGIEVALSIYRAMILDKISPDEFSYSIMLSALGREGYTAEALQLCEAAVSAGIGILDTISINSLLKAFADGANPLQSVLLYLELTSSDRASARTFSNLQFDRQKWKRLEFVPNQATFSILFSAIMRSGSDKSAPVNAAFLSNVSPATMRSIYATLLAEKVHVIKANSTSHIASFIRRLIIENYRSADYNKKRKVVELSASAQQNIKLLESMGPNTILNRLYRQMRFEYNIEPDAMLISTLKSMFSSTNQMNRNEDGILWFGFKGYDEETARLVFEDLITLGIHPKEIVSIMRCCQYPMKRMNQLLNDEDFLLQLRSSSASSRIFKKYGWNNVDSRWSPF